MYRHSLHSKIHTILSSGDIDIAGKDSPFYTRLVANAASIHDLYKELYGAHPAGEEQFLKLIETIVKAHQSRPGALIEKDEEKLEKGHWFLSNKITGMSLYVDRFCGNLKNIVR